MAVRVKPGDVFLIPLPTKTLKHAHIVITAVDLITGKFLCVPLNTCKNKRLDDRTVVFQKGDHPFVDHPTYVNYNKACFLEIALLEVWLNDGDAKEFMPLTQVQLDSVCEGLNKSPHIKPRILQQYTEIRMKELFGKKRKE